MSETLFLDIETYPNFFLIGLKRLSDGKKRFFELSDRKPTLDLDLIQRILLENRIITFNGMGFDMPVTWYATRGASLDQIKLAADRIIQGGMRYWEVERELGISIPRSIDHIDLIEPQPNPFASLKLLNARLHGPKLQDLPYPPDQPLTHTQMDEVTAYCGNDLDATHLLFDALAEPLALREELGKKFGMDLRSKSDAQMGEQIIKRRVEQITGERVEKVPTPAGTTFQYQAPEWLKFEHPELQEILDRLRTTQFIVKHDGKVDMPDWLDGKKVVIAGTEYAMGIGGLHSTEKNRSIFSTWSHQLIDFDVAAFYPRIIQIAGLYPKALGPAFLDVFGQIRADRIDVKARLKTLKARLLSTASSGAGLTADASQDAILGEIKVLVTADQGYKIALNGCFGKLGSVYSVLYAPHLLLFITLTGQLALLMLIDRARQREIPVMSANTDGVVFSCPREIAALPINKDGRLTGEGVLRAMVEEWERETGFELEANAYRSLHSSSVNTYIAIKEDGKAKRKGKLLNPHRETMRDQLMHNPNMGICSDAVVEHIVNGTPLEDTIRASRDIRDFVTAVNVRGGATWRGEHLGKVVRYIWSTDGEPIFYKVAHATTGNFKKVSKTDDCRPMMDWPDHWPDDIDYARYVAEARSILVDIGFDRAPIEVKKPRVLKARRVDWLIESLAA